TASGKNTRGMGTPLYMAPEQIQGTAPIGPAADVYALGHIAYALLVGEAYWHEELAASETLFPVLIRIANGSVEPACARAQRRRGVALPLAFDGWFERATATRAEDRFASASELVVALAASHGAPSHRAAAPAARTGDTLASSGADPLSAARAPALA